MMDGLQQRCENFGDYQSFNRIFAKLVRRFTITEKAPTIGSYQDESSYYCFHI